MIFGMVSRRRLLKCVGLMAILSTGVAFPVARGDDENGRFSRHVLLISVDGLHAIDLERFVESHPQSALAELSRHGYTYTQASCSIPSDSFPGLLALITGGSPISTGVWYDNSYDRTFLPPGGGAPGTDLTYDETIDLDPSQLFGGGAINTSLLPLDPARGNAPVMPWQLLRVNTIFEVAKAAGLRTAWSDKHFGAYQIVQGPSGHGVDDLYSPEINSDPKNSLNPAVDPKITDFTKSHVEVKRYDAIKKDAIVNECFGLDSTGIHHAGTPAIFGMNFQTVSVAQKLASAVDSSLKGGYLDADASPSTAIDSALEFVDASIGEMVSALRQCRLLAATTIIITAKHGQSPIDPRKRRVVDDGKLADAVNSVEANLAAHVTADDVALIWLSDPSKTADAAEALRASDDLNSLPAETDPNDPTITWPARQGIQEVLWGEALKLRFADPAADSRTPDIIVFPTPGIIYSSAKSKKLAEHGGSTHDDVNVALLVSTAALPRRVIKTPVQTMQVAPTILKFLGLNPRKLDAVRLQQTDELPGFDSEEGEK